MLGASVVLLFAAIALYSAYRNTRHPTRVHDPYGESTSTRHISIESKHLINALRQILSNPSGTTNQSRFMKATTHRGDALAQLQGYVKISDLVNYPDLETSLINFVDLTQDFDSNILRLETAYDTAKSHLEAFIATFCIDFHKLLEDANRQLCPNADCRRRQHPRYESMNDTIQRQNLTRQLHEIKLFVSVIASSIIGAMSILHDDTVTEIDVYFNLHYDRNREPRSAYSTPPSKPTISNHNLQVNNSPDESAIIILVDRLSSLPTTHPLYATLRTEIQSIVNTTAGFQPIIRSMQKYFFDVDDTLHDLINEVKGLNICTLGVKAGKIIALMSRLNDDARNVQD